MEHIQKKIDKIACLKSKKRPEENSKFVFKGTMKTLKFGFYKENGLKNGK